MSEPLDAMDERDTFVGTAMEQYEISQKIGEGSIGTIYKAYDLISQRDVAIKFLTREVGSSPQILERFKREIETTIKMAHPNIVKGYTAGVWEGCIYYYVMEFVDGSTLHDLMAREKMTEELAVEIMVQMGQALKYINEFGMVHRDVKPENIMITREGLAKLADLGLAKAKDDMSGVTLAGTIIGTPLYMSPEQAKGSSIIDIRADVYSLGATVYHVVTGEPPFKGNSAPVVIAKQINEIPRPVRELNPSLSPGLEYVISKSMEKDPARRYQKPADLLADLTLIQEGKGSCTETFVPWGLLAAEAKEKEFHFAYFPNEDDFEFALTAVANKLVERGKLPDLLDFQEEMAKQGVPLKLAYLTVENGLLTEEQANRIKNAQRRRRFKEAGSEFGSIAIKARFVSQAQVDEALKRQEEARARSGENPLLGNILKDLGYLDERQIGLVLAQQSSVKHQPEDRMFLKLATKRGLVAKSLVEKALTVQQNEVAMGTYREIGDILVERKYIPRAARDVLLRAIRRKHLTGEGVEDLIAEREAVGDEPRATATIHLDADLLKKYQERIDGLVRQGKICYKKRDFQRAINTWREVLEILASHEETETLLRKTQDIVDNLEGHLAQASNFFELALREWKAVLKIKTDYPGAVDGMSLARAKLAKLVPDRDPAEDDLAGTPFDELSTVLKEKVPREEAAPSDGAEAPDDAPSAEEGEDDGDEDRDAQRVQRMMKKARRFLKDGRSKRAKQTLQELLADYPYEGEAVQLLATIRKRERRVAAVCLLLMVLLAAGALTAFVLVYGPLPSLNLLMRVLGSVREFLEPA